MNERTDLKFNINGGETSDYEKLSSQILERVGDLSASGFERLVTDLLLKMGYEVYRNVKRRLSPSAIQAIIVEDGQGFRPIYIQTRKLERGSIITSWSMQGFGDAVARKAGKGLMVTNANFSKPAQQYAKEKGIILIDGNILARLMIVNNFCVNVREVFEVRTIDPSAFSEYYKGE